MPNLTINGASLAYAEYGQGEPLVLVHGSASDQRTWHLQQERFGEHFRVVNYSRRYHWPNDGIPEGADYVFLEHVDDLHALLRELVDGPAHLVGHSYGAFVCLLLAVKSSHLVRSLVLAEPPAITLFVSNVPKPHEILRLSLTRPRTAMAILKFGVKGMAPAVAAARRGELPEAMHLFGKTILGQTYYGRLSEERLAQVDANTFKAEFLGSGFVPLAADQVRKVTSPTLLINGRHSHPLFHRITERLAELLPNQQRVEIAAASHIMHEDNPTDFNQAVLSFLKPQHGSA